MNNKDMSVANPASPIPSWHMGISQAPPKKPKRPLSAFNLFFQHERARILLLAQKGKSVNSYPPVRLKTEHIRELLQNNPFRVDQTRRRHRKSHGTISFSGLMKQVTASWKAIDEVTRASFQELANESKEDYFKKLKIYKQQIKAMALKRNLECAPLHVAAEESASQSTCMESNEMHNKTFESLVQISSDSAYLMISPADASSTRENFLYSGPTAHQTTSLSKSTEKPVFLRKSRSNEAIGFSEYDEHYVHTCTSMKQPFCCGKLNHVQSFDLEPNQAPFSCSLDDTEVIVFLKDLDWAKYDT